MTTSTPELTPELIGKSLTKTTARSYSAEELEGLAELLDANIRTGHDIPSCFNGNTLSRLIAQAYRFARDEPRRAPDQGAVTELRRIANEARLLASDLDKAPATAKFVDPGIQRSAFAMAAKCDHFLEAARIVEASLSPPNQGEEVERLRAALSGLEAACDAVAAGRTRETYLQMLSDGQDDQLLALDDARLKARALLSKAPGHE